MGTFFKQDPVLDEAFVATGIHRLGNVINLISGSRVVLGAFARKGRIISLAAGHTFTQPILMAESGVPTWFTGMDPVSKDFTPGLTAAEYSMSWMSAPMRMELTTRLENSGNGRVMDIGESRFRQVRITVQNDLARKFLNGTGGRQPVGLLKAIEAAAVGSQVEVVGGIDKATYQWWNNQYRELGAGVRFGDSVGGIPAGILLYMQLFLDCCHGNVTPNFLFVNEAQGENFLRAMMILYGMRSAGKIDETVEPTPHNVQLFGRPVISTDELPADTGLWLTSSADTNGTLQGRDSPDGLGELSPSELGGIYSVYHPEMNMAMDGPRVGTNSHVSYTFILHSMSNVFENMAQQGRAGSHDVGGLDNWS